MKIAVNASAPAAWNFTIDKKNREKRFRALYGLRAGQRQLGHAGLERARPLPALAFFLVGKSNH